MNTESIDSNEGLDALIEKQLNPLAVKNALDVSTRTFTARHKRVIDNRNLLLRWIRKNLVEGIDFGRVRICSPRANTPAFKCDKGNRCTTDWHYSKPSMWKAGAEKTLALLGLRPHWPGLKDLERQVIETGHAPADIILRCYAIDAKGHILGEGAGARSLKQDGAVNKMIKMAKKSGMIDMVLTLAGLSELFTQDIADDDLAMVTADLTERAEVCEFGPYRGHEWTKVPDEAMRDLQEHPDVPDDAKAIIRKELDRRAEEGETVVEPEYPDQAAPAEWTMKDAAQALLNARTTEALEQVWVAIGERFQTPLRHTYDTVKEQLNG